VPCAKGWQGYGYACIIHAETKPKYLPKNDEERAAVQNFEAATAAYVNRWKKNLQTAQASVRIVDLPDANHYLFLSNERDVVSELRQFVANLK